MNASGESMDQRRAHLAAQIARQRGELADAYHHLAQPIQYGENALRGFGFLRQNPWVLSVVPAALSIASTLWGLRKGKGAKPSRSQRQELGRLERRPKSFGGHVLKLGGHGWRLFQLYRRLRRFFL